MGLKFFASVFRPFLYRCIIYPYRFTGFNFLQYFQINNKLFQIWIFFTKVRSLVVLADWRYSKFLCRARNFIQKITSKICRMFFQSVPHPVLYSTRLCLCFWILVFFHSEPIYSYFVFLSAVSSAINQCVFLFEILRVFLLIEIYFFRYFSCLFLSSRVKNHICILWNPNPCFNNNNESVCDYHGRKDQLFFSCWGIALSWDW